MRLIGLAVLTLLCVTPVSAQEPEATDVTADAIQAFIDALPRDRVSDRPIRVVDVTGDYRVGVYGVYRPQSVPGGANKHEVNTTAGQFGGHSLPDTTGSPSDQSSPILEVAPCHKVFQKRLIVDSTKEILNGQGRHQCIRALFSFGFLTDAPGIRIDCC
mgnify:CR=1 FL=1